jgi:hypothetical protein
MKIHFIIILLPAECVIPPASEIALLFHLLTFIMIGIPVEIDVTKGKSTVSAFSWDEKILIKPHDVPHTSDSLKNLATELKQLDGEVRIILEHTGRYWFPISQVLHGENLFVTAANPKLIKNFGDNKLNQVFSKFY